MLHTFLIIFTMSLFSVFSNAQNLSTGIPLSNNRGGISADANGDATVDVADISAILNSKKGNANGITGDVNGDGIVDAADVTGALGFMANEISSTSFPLRRANGKDDVTDVSKIIGNMANDPDGPASDVNGDGLVDVADITSAIGIVKNEGSTINFLSRRAGQKSALTVEPVTIAKGGTADLVIRMDYETTETIAGVNFSLYLPDGIVLDGFDSKEAMLNGKASALKNACDLGEDGVWGGEADKGWFSVRAKADGGLLFVLIDNDDQTPFESTHAKLITIRLKALEDVSNVTGKVSQIAISNDISVSLDLNNIADEVFTITGVGTQKKTVLTAESVTIANGGTADLVVRMNYETTETVVGLNFSLYLPDGIVLDGFDSKEAMLNGKASALKKAFDLGTNGVWGSYANSGWLSVKGKADGGLLVVLIDQDDQTPFVSTNTQLLTIKLKAIADVSKAYGELKGISLSNENSVSLDLNNIADTSFAINENGIVSNPVTITANSYTITYGDALPHFDYQVTGATLNGTPTISCTANANSDAGVYDIIVSKGSVSNSNVTCVNGTLTIQKAQLTASVGNYTKKQGDAMPAFTITYSGFKKNQTKSVLTREPTISCNATEVSSPGTYPITLSGGQAKNYEFIYRDGTLTVTAADAVVVTANDYTITYGDPLPSFGYTVTGGAYNGTPNISCSANSSSDAGTYDIYISEGSGTNYNVRFVKGTLTILKAQLTASVGNYTKKQGDAMPAFTITYSGFKKNQTKSVLTREPTISCNATEASSPGTYPITLSGGRATNYDFTYQNGMLTVTESDAVVITANSYTIEYGDPLPDFGYEVSGAALKGVPNISCNATANSNAGTYTITVSKGSVTNEDVTCVNGTLTIKKAVLTAYAGNYTKKQGDPMPDFSITYSGFKKGQNEGALSKVPTLSCNANESSAPGSYPITISGGQATNYDFVYKNGVLTVLPANAAMVTAKSYTITYGDALPKFGYETSGEAINGTPKISCSANSNSDAGTYDIIISQGSISNYNVTYVNGKLTIKKATLTASVGNYKRKQGADNPPFTITYQGFKKGQNKSVIDKEPVVSCSATKDSPAGIYPITLSGGSAKNYDFKYVNGKLTVVNGYNLSIMSVGNGTTTFEDQTIGQNSSIVVLAYPDETYTLSFKPESGYKLGKLLWNDVDIVNKVVNKSYKLSNVSQTSSLVAIYEEALGEFTVDGITYKILSSADNTVTVTRGNYSGHVVIPPTVKDKGVLWRVVGIQNFAFSNTPLKTIVIPSTVEEANMGGGLFAECQELAAITWKADFAMTSNMYSGMTNPNLLFYAHSASYAPKGVKNVVVNVTAEEIILVDAEGSHDFYCPTAFTAKKISYTHNYSMTSGFAGEARGWESIALPFDVQSVMHATKGAIVPFAAATTMPAARPFWLFSLTSTGFKRANSIEANTPYILSMPNNEEYDDDYILSGEVTFSATQATVKATSAVNSKESGSKTFVPAFSATEKSNTIYVLNAVNGYHAEDGGYAEGSRFVSALRSVSPFEAYMTDDSGSARLFIDIEFSEATAIDDLNSSEANKELDGHVYNTAGMKVDSGRLQNGSLPSGLYIINGKKVINRRR